MPLYKTITPYPSTIVRIWKIEETESELLKGISLDSNSQIRFGKMKSELHRRGFLSIRHLMLDAGYTDSEMYYDDFGKPHLKDGRHISITHSHHFTGIIVSDTIEVGIDIEQQRDKILRIAHKFTPIEEYKTIANVDALVRKLTIVWGCKESLYKICSNEGISFLHHIDITDFSLSDDYTTGEILYHGKSSLYDISFFEFEGFTCVYALSKK
jgi:4'-phosphopantetheinyl transferase